MLLPKSYILAVDNRKKDKSHPKKKSPEELLLAVTEPIPKSKIVPQVTTQVAAKKIPIKMEAINESVKPCLKTV